MSTPSTFDFATFTDNEVKLLIAARRLYEAMKAEPARKDEKEHRLWRKKITEEAVCYIHYPYYSLH